MMFYMPYYIGKIDEVDSEEFIKGIEDAIKKSGRINRKLAHSILIGHPGSGKTSLIKRLLHRPRGEGNTFSKSTPVCESIVIVDINEIIPSSTLHTLYEPDCWC